MNFVLAVVVLLPFFGAVLVALSAKIHKYAPALSALIITSSAIFLLYPFIGLVANGQTVIQSTPWIAQIGLFFAFRADGLSLFFAYIILIIGLMVIIYSAFYLSKKYSWGRFFSCLLMFMGSMLGIVLSENVLLLVIFWELTSLTSFLLISFWQDKSESRQGARMALIVTGLGGLAMLGGMLIIGNIAGSFNLTDIFNQAQLIRDHPLSITALLLLLIGAFSKSAQFPFHFWLPQAMAAPTPVSAYLHSATMVKAGLFLMARFSPVFAETSTWFWLLTIVGLTTMTIGAYTAMFRDDLKALLAYSTISNLGLITLLLGLGSELAMVAAMLHIFNHASYKAPLFMVAGIVDHQCGFRDIKKLGGLFILMPLTSTLAIIASASMAGLPLLNGFLSKELFFEQLINFAHIDAWQNGNFEHLSNLWLPIIVVIATAFTVCYSCIFVYRVFFGRRAKNFSDEFAEDFPDQYPIKPVDPSIMMNFPVMFFVSICVVIGLFPYLLNDALAVVVKDALQISSENMPKVDVVVHYSISPPLIMSIIAIVCGLLVFYWHKHFVVWHQKYFAQIDSTKIFDYLLKKSINGAEIVTNFLQKDSLKVSIFYIISFALAASFVTYINFADNFLGTRELLSVDVLSVIFFFILILSTIMTAIWHEKRMQALLSMAAVGLVVSLIFLKFSAIDLALTQLSVELVTTVLLMLALFLFPLPGKRKSDLGGKFKQWRAITLAGLCGVGVSALTMAVLSRDFSSIAPYYLAKTISEGGGANVVNVILVDFRGIDTQGEIVVLAMAGLGVFALLRGIKLRNTRILSVLKNPWCDDVHPLILRTMSRVLFPMLLLVAVYVFLRGHNEPGGGFIAGLIAAIALILQYLANGVLWTGERMKFNMFVVLGMGILVAAGTGIASLFLGYPFLTSTYAHINLPIIGEFELASAALFDTGVFLVVISTLVIALLKLGTARET